MPIILTGSGSTVQTVIDRALRLLGQLEPGESADDDEAADVLVALNAMLDSWRNERLMCFAILDLAITLAAGDTALTIGPSGDYVTTRPVEIQAASIDYGDISVDLDVIDEARWLAIPLKSSTATYPCLLYYEPDMPDGTLNLWPVPSAASTLHLLVRTPLIAFGAVTDALNLPPGWEEAMTTNLAISVAPYYEKDPRPSVVQMAKQSKAAIKQVNSKPILASSDLTLLFGGRRPNILIGQ